MVAEDGFFLEILLAFLTGADFSLLVLFAYCRHRRGCRLLLTTEGKATANLIETRLSPATLRQKIPVSPKKFNGDLDGTPQHQLTLTLRNRFAILSNEEKDFPDEDDQPPAQEKPRNPELCKTENLTLLPEPRESLKRDLETSSRLEPQNPVKEPMHQGPVKAIRNSEISNVNQEGKDNELLCFNGKISGHAAVILIGIKYEQWMAKDNSP